MRKDNFNFTKARLQELQPRPKAYFVKDTMTAHLRLAVYPSGVKTFLLCRRVKNQPQRIKIGRLSDLSIEQARKQADKLNAHIALGGDPQADKYAVRREPSFKDLFDYYYHNHALHFTKRPEDNKKTIEFNILPVFGDIKASLVTPEKVRSFHLSLAERTTPANANRVISLILAVYNLCIKNSHYKGTNPCFYVKRFKTVSRDRFLNKVELQAFFNALNHEKSIFKDYFSLLLYTGARKSNVLSMRWVDINFELKFWRISEKDAKNSEVNTVYLSDSSLELLERRKQENEALASPSLYVFPGDGETGHLKDPKKAFQRIKDRMDVQDIRMHDLRRTLASYMAITGASMPIIGVALNHKDLDSTAIYARLAQKPVLDAINAATGLIHE